MSAIDQLVAHVLQRRDGLPAQVQEAAKTFILDAAGVGLAGSRHPRMPQVLAAVAALGGTSPATGPIAHAWGSGVPLPWGNAVMVNAYQVFNQEFDCIHDAAVIHAMACLLPACLGYAEAHGGVSGPDLIDAVTLGLDVAIYIGLAQRAPMRFFRPAMCGALGATAALALLGRLDERGLRDALGLAYSQLSGTMQAHVEGSPAVGLQVGLNARAAATAFTLAAAGFPGPRDVLEGPFGYFALFDFGQSDWPAVARDVGQVFQITQMSHKPYPTGRATHGGIEGALKLQREHGFATADVEQVTVHASALVVRLVGRPALSGMDAGYARLCMAYGVATALQTGDVGLTDFEAPALCDASRLALAHRVQTIEDEQCDPNAIGGPQRVEARLKDGRRFMVELDQLLGHPQHPLSRDEQDRKFDRCCAFAQPVLAPSQSHLLRGSLRQLQDCNDVRRLMPLFLGGPAASPTDSPSAP
jgi:2-methylcitrate dehydratase PrpD